MPASHLMAPGSISQVTGREVKVLWIFMYLNLMKMGNGVNAVNLGSAINTPFNEDTPFISHE